MKKLIIGIISALVFGTASAQDYSEIIDKIIDKELIVNFYKGWNLVGMGMLEVLDNEPNNIRALYVYDPRARKFVGGTLKKLRSDPVLGRKFENTMKYVEDINDDEYNIDKGFALFVYLSHDFEASGKFVSQAMTEYGKFNLVKGWNPISTLSLLPGLGQTFAQVKGDCDIQKIYFFENRTHKFIPIKLDFKINEILDDPGSGLFVKTSNNCSLDFTEYSDISELPSLPN